MDSVNVRMAAWIAAVLVAFTGCSGNVNTIPVSALTLSPASIGFTATGASAAQTVVASKPNYSGSFIAATAAAGQPGSCSGIAAISSATGTSFTVTPSAAGACVFTIDGGGQRAILPITVTTTSFGGS